VVIKKTTLQRYAFTMIELIFAIVIISIAVVSLPIMTKITEKGLEESILQEAIFAASAELISASAGYWDEHSMNDMNRSYLSRVINLAGDCNFDKLRPGHIAQPLHRRCLDSNSTAQDAAGGIFYDLNDAGQTDVNLTVTTSGNSAEAHGYKNTYKSTITIAPAVNNIKIITSIIKNYDNEPIVKLQMQSANIGEIDYYKRRF